MSVYAKYGFSRKDMPSFNKFKTQELEDILIELRSRLIELETKSKNLLLLAEVYEKAITEQQKRESRKVYKELQLLADEEHLIKVAENCIKNTIFKRRRNMLNISSKALNHGGVYTDTHFHVSRKNEGFKGFRGVCL